MTRFKGSFGHLFGLAVVFAVVLTGFAPMIAGFLSSEVVLVALMVGLWMLLPMPQPRVAVEAAADGFWGHRGRA